MIIRCFRCNRAIDTPGSSNADYVMAEDMKELTLEGGSPRDVQKTGIICPGCHRPSDFVIWGVHKGGKK